MKKKSESEAERIEFESDGRIDSLTHALAPASFQDLLANEFSISKREGRVITLISVRLLDFPRANLARDVHDADEDIDQLKKFVESTAPVLRTGDAIGRISEDGFWILIRGDRKSAEKARERFSEVVDASQWRWEYCASQVREVGEDFRAFLRRMDSVHFTKVANL